MPIEIRELHIRVNVTPPATRQEGAAATTSQAGENSTSAKEKQEIIAECVEQVMKMLKNQKER